MTAAPAHLGPESYSPRVEEGECDVATPFTLNSLASVFPSHSLMSLLLLRKVPAALDNFSAQLLSVLRLNQTLCGSDDISLFHNLVQTSRHEQLLL